MSVKVARTCTVIHGSAGDSVQVGESVPLSKLRSVPTYVLLGDPGAGKTTEFRRECDASKASGAFAHYETARDFITLDADSHRDRILFIDGLDEVRAGSTDARSPLDRIRHRLDRIRPPGFRISCREADWLGQSDLLSLARVSPDGKVLVVRLDPLNANSVRELLRPRITGDLESFIKEAELLGVRPLLENPLTLKLLAGAVSQGRSWPESRRQMFQVACADLLATEHNVEHLAVSGAEPGETIMNVAGYLCALLLTAGIEGFTLSPQAHRGSFVPLIKLDERRGIPNSVAEQVLATRLFTAVGERAFRPHHRHMAEFLAGRYLAILVNGGLPARRVTALITSPSDGRVVTELRGLSAWIAAYAGEARRLLIDADPVGVGLYGDIGGFSKDDKSRLLTSLATFAEEGALFGHGWRDGRESGFRDNTAWSFRSLVSAEMAPLIAGLIRTGRAEGPRDRVVDFVLRVLSKVAGSDLESLADLSPDLEAMVGDAARSPGARLVALNAYLNVAPPGGHKTRVLRDLLESLRRGELSDPDDQLRGTLLDHLYPDELSLAELWRYASPRNNQQFAGRFWIFWNLRFVEKSSDSQVAYLLDTMGDWLQSIETLETLDLEDIPLRLLARGLEAMGDDLDIAHLYRWLRDANPRFHGYASERYQNRVRAWLEERPDIQKQLIIERLRRHPNDSPIHVPMYGDELHGSKRPADLGKWCLEQAVNLCSDNPALSKQLFQLAFWSTNQPSVSQGLSLDLIDHHSKGLPELEKLFATLSKKQKAQRDLDNEAAQEQEKRTELKDEEHEQRREDWQRHLRAHESELSSNTFSPQNLHTLALAYSGEMSTHHNTASLRDNIGDLIGSDWSLVDAVISSLRSATFRDDLPSVDETIALCLQSRTPWLTTPVLVSMDLLADEPETLVQVSDENRRRALALYYCFPALHRVQDGKRVQSCYETWLDQNPALVIGVLYQCAAAALRSGAEYLPGVNHLHGIERDHDLAQETRLRLLEAFPTRIPSRQLELFDDLLRPALAHTDRSPLVRLASKKLAKKSLSVPHRIRWMTVDALLRGGKRTEQLRVHAGANERRTRHLAEFLHNTREYPDRTWIGLDIAGSELVACLIELLGRSYGPQQSDGFVTVDISTSDLVTVLISQLGSMADAGAIARLARLVQDPRLARWRSRLIWAQQRQRHLRRDLSYAHPDVRQVQRTLDGRAPANVADLAALLSDRLKDIRDRIRGDSANPWRHFWNEDSDRRPTKAKPEESCRDVLLELLRARLPAEVDLVPEGRYAGERRADIRASHGGYNVPVEIKKNGYQKLWSALRGQLIDQYTTDPATTGYGIYLVLWFGPEKTKPPPRGPRPETPEELRGRLEKDLTAEQARKISVIVMDVTRP